MACLKPWKRRSRSVCSQKGYPPTPTMVVCSPCRTVFPLNSNTNRITGDRLGCQCDSSGSCHCCIPRKTAPRIRKKDASGPRQISADDARSITSTAQYELSPNHPSQIPTHILARIAELRPVLPRPNNKDPAPSGPVHNPSSSTAHGHPTRHHPYEKILFSPYGRAYDLTYEYNHDQPQNEDQSEAQRQITSSQSPFSIDEQSFRDQLRALEVAASSPWPSLTGAQTSTAPSFPSVCGCGDNCQCPGCIMHNGASDLPSSSAFSLCMNPGACSTCLDCTILSLPASLPLDTPLSLYDGYQSQSIDEWIRQVSSLPLSSPDLSGANLSVTSRNSHTVWNTLDMSHNSGPSSDTEQMDVRTSGHPSTTGIESGTRDIDYDFNGTNHASGLTFATSGERASCSGGSRADVGGVISTAMHRPSGPSGNQSSPPSFLEMGYLAAPGMPRSRSSSISSISNRSHSSVMSTTGYSPSSPIGRVQGPFYDPKKVFSTPDLSTRSNVDHAAGRSTSMGIASPSASGRQGFAYAQSNPDSDGSVDDSHSHYDPSLDGMRLS